MTNEATAEREGVWKEAQLPRHLQFDVGNVGGIGETEYGIYEEDGAGWSLVHIPTALPGSVTRWADPTWSATQFAREVVRRYNEVPELLAERDALRERVRALEEALRALEPVS